MAKLPPGEGDPSLYQPEQTISQEESENIVERQKAANRIINKILDLTRLPQFKEIVAEFERELGKEGITLSVNLGYLFLPTRNTEVERTISVSGRLPFSQDDRELSFIISRMKDSATSTKLENDQSRKWVGETDVQDRGKIVIPIRSNPKESR